MRIAQVTPLAESVLPRLYGGTERVVSDLTEVLVRRGHDVVLFASGGSDTSAELVACCPEGLRLNPHMQDHVAYTMVELGKVSARARQFDIIHNHVDYLALPTPAKPKRGWSQRSMGTLTSPNSMTFTQSFPNSTSCRSVMPSDAPFAMPDGWLPSTMGST
jgi:hypothetical protein